VTTAEDGMANSSSGAMRRFTPQADLDPCYAQQSVKLGLTCGAPRARQMLKEFTVA